MTVLTDVLLGVCTAWWGIDLLRRGRARRERSQVLWGLGFMAAAVAALLGGASHAVGEQAPAARRALWKGTLLATGFTSAGILASTVVAAAPRPYRRWLLAGTAAKLLAYCGWMASRDRFRYVIMDYGTAMAGVMALHAPALRRPDTRGSGYIVGGVVVSVIAALVQQRKVKLHRHFNHNDLYHLIQLGACYLFYRGGRNLRDRREETAREQSHAVSERATI